MANVDSPEKTRRLAQAASSGRSVICRVLLLDGTTYDIDVDKKAVGLVLFDKVCDHLDLLEKDYFGLNFIDPKTNLESWLNLDKKISKQMKDQAWHFNFEIKFYPTDVHQLHEDLTRYQLCLQIRRDIVSEKLPCSFVTYSLLGSYTVQSELGDWEMEEFGPGVDYIKGMRFAPTQDRDLLKKIVELHKTHKGQTPEEAELHFLDNAKKLSLYGVYLHDAKDGEGVDIQLGICASGVMIYKDKLQINRFVWPKVVKMSYRRNKFYIKLRPGEFEDFQSMIAFKLLSIKHSKRLWKLAVEHHSFFRFKESDMPRKRGLLKLGSKFRYSGRTLYQSKMAVSAVDRPMPNFDRIHSKRATYGGRPNKRPHEIEDYYSRPTREPRSSERQPKPEVRNDNFIDRNPEDEPPPARNEPDRSEDEDEDPIDTKHRMEKMHAIPTPLALMNKEREQTENNNGQPRHMEEPEDDRPEPRRERRDDYRREPEEDMVRTRIIGRRARQGKGRQPMYGLGTNHNPIHRPLTLSDSYISKSCSSDLSARKSVSFRDDLKEAENLNRKKNRQKVRYYSKYQSARNMQNGDSQKAFSSEDVSNQRTRNENVAQLKKADLPNLPDVRHSLQPFEDFTDVFMREEIRSHSSSVDFVDSEDVKFDNLIKSKQAQSKIKNVLSSENQNNSCVNNRSKRNSYAYDYSSQSENDSLTEMSISNNDEVFIPSAQGKSFILSNSGYKSFEEGMKQSIRRQSSSSSLRKDEIDNESERLHQQGSKMDCITEKEVFNPESNETILLEKYMINRQKSTDTVSSCGLLDLSFSEEQSFLNSSITSNMSVDSAGRKTLIKTNGSFNRSVSLEKYRNLTKTAEDHNSLTEKTVKFNLQSSPRSVSDLCDIPEIIGERPKSCQINSADRIKIKTCLKVSKSVQNIGNNNSSVKDENKNGSCNYTIDTFSNKTSNFEQDNNSNEPKSEFKLDSYSEEPRRIVRIRSETGDSNNSEKKLRNSVNVRDENEYPIVTNNDMNDSGIFESSLDNRKKKTAKNVSLSTDTKGVEAASCDGEIVSTEVREQDSMISNGSSVDNVLRLLLKDKNNVKHSKSDESKSSDLTDRDKNQDVINFSQVNCSQTNCEKLEPTEQHLLAIDQLDSPTMVQVSSGDNQQESTEYLSNQQHNCLTNGQRTGNQQLSHQNFREQSHQNSREQSHPNREPSYPSHNPSDRPRIRRHPIARTPSFRLPTHNRQTMPEDIHILTQFFVTLVICAISLLSLFYEIS